MQKQETGANYFAELYKVNVAEHVEKKNGFSYVSWPFAVAELRKRHPTATWEVCRFDGMPFLKSSAGYFVEVAVTVEGVRLSQIHPVLDHANRPIKEPTAFHINTSIQRALVKAIALHGLGLFVYAGEDLPEDAAESKARSSKDDDNGAPGAIIFRGLQPEIQDYLRKAAPHVDAAIPNVDRAIQLIEMAVDNWPDADQAHVKTGLWHLLDSATRSAIKKQMKETTNA